MKLFHRWPRVEISAATWGEGWPLTVDRGRLELRNKHHVIFIAGRRQYAVNGLAKQNKWYRPIDEIWADNPDVPGLKKNIGKLIERGLSLGL
jgi:hypothetical protein